MWNFDLLNQLHVQGFKYIVRHQIKDYKRCDLCNYMKVVTSERTCIVNQSFPT